MSGDDFRLPDLDENISVKNFSFDCGGDCKNCGGCSQFGNPKPDKKPDIRTKEILIAVSAIFLLSAILLAKSGLPAFIGTALYIVAYIVAGADCFFGVINGFGTKNYFSEYLIATVSTLCVLVTAGFFDGALSMLFFCILTVFFDRVKRLPKNPSERRRMTDGKRRAKEKTGKFRVICAILFSAAAIASLVLYAFGYLGIGVSAFLFSLSRTNSLTFGAMLSYFFEKPKRVGSCFGIFAAVRLLLAVAAFFGCPLYISFASDIVLAALFWAVLK